MDLEVHEFSEKWSKTCFHSCDGNSGFYHDLIFLEVLEWDDIVWFIIFQFISGRIFMDWDSCFVFNPKNLLLNLNPKNL